MLGLSLLISFVVVSVLVIGLVMIQPGKQQQSLLETSDSALFQQKKVRGFERTLQLLTMFLIIVWLCLAVGLMLL